MNTIAQDSNDHETTAETPKEPAAKPAPKAKGKAALTDEQLQALKAEVEMAAQLLALGVATLVETSNTAKKIGETYALPAGIVRSDIEKRSRAIQKELNPPGKKDKNTPKSYAPASDRTVIRYILDKISQNEDGWHNSIRFTQKGSPIISVWSVSLILRNWPDMAGVFAEDRWIGRVVLRRPPPWAVEEGATAETWVPRQMEELDRHRLLAWFHRHVDEKVGADTIWAGLADAAAACWFDPALEFVNTVRFEWDGKPRFEEMAREALHQSPGIDTDVASHILRWTFIAAVARIKEPGCQVHHVLVLQGPQGTYKSTALRKITPKDEWFSDRLSMKKIGDKDEAVKTRGVLIIEMPELDRLPPGLIGELKNFITTPEDEYRVAYGRVMERHRREHAPISPHLLKDDTTRTYQPQTKFTSISPAPSGA